MKKDMIKRTSIGTFTTREQDGGKWMDIKPISFTSCYDICPGGKEQISPDLIIEGDDIRALVNHDSTLVLGRTKAGTMFLTRKEDGIYASILINPNDSDAMNCYHRVKRGDVTQCSFGFDILDRSTEILPDGTTMWTIRKIYLYEVSICTFPAYEDTEAQARMKELEDANKRKAEAWRARMLQKLKGEKEC